MIALQKVIYLVGSDPLVQYFSSSPLSLLFSLSFHSFYFSFTMLYSTIYYILGVSNFKLTNKLRFFTFTKLYVCGYVLVKNWCARVYVWVQIKKKTNICHKTFAYYGYLRIQFSILIVFFILDKSKRNIIYLLLKIKRSEL